MSELKDLEFLAEKSREFIDKQISAYRQKHTNAGSIMAIVALFTPFFLTGLEDSYVALRIISIIPIGLFIYSISLFFEVLKSKSFDQGFSVNKFDELVNKQNYEQVLLYEIGANRDSFNDNEKVLDKSNKCFTLGIRLTLISVIASVVILLGNNFWKPTKEDKIQKLEIINIPAMANDSTPQNTPTTPGPTTPSQAPTNTAPSGPRVIPYVPPSDRTNLNENVGGIQTKRDTNNKR